jgi:hypothetical protein
MPANSDPLPEKEALALTLGGDAMSARSCPPVGNVMPAPPMLELVGPNAIATPLNCKRSTAKIRMAISI